MNTPNHIPPQQFQTALLGWYARGHRAMPWRDETASPYHIWLAEVMLQQTTVTAVIPYYQRFLQRFPTLQSLAEAPIDDVLQHWQGLGYYRRAHMLHKCAQTILQNHNGRFPTTEAELLTLPGLGPYTAAVIAATAFNTAANVVDGNVERVISRLYRVQQELPAAKNTLRNLAAHLSPTEHGTQNTRHSQYANAIMELGSQVCTPTNPQCLLCPVAQWCEANHHGDQTTYPRKAPKKQTPHHTATAWLITDAAGHIYLQQRPATGLLASLYELPHSGWEPKSTPQQAPLPLDTQTECDSITHVFSHFKLTLNLLHTEVETIPAANRFTTDNLPALSTLMRKALTHALKRR